MYISFLSFFFLQKRTHVIALAQTTCWIWSCLSMKVRNLSFLRDFVWVPACMHRQEKLELCGFCFWVNECKFLCSTYITCAMTSCTLPEWVYILKQCQSPWILGALKVKRTFSKVAKICQNSIISASILACRYVFSSTYSATCWFPERIGLRWHLGVTLAVMSQKIREKFQASIFFLHPFAVIFGDVKIQCWKIFRFDCFISCIVREKYAKFHGKK